MITNFQRTARMLAARRALNLPAKRVQRTRVVPRAASFAPIQREYAAAILRSVVARIRPAFDEVESMMPDLLASVAREMRVDADEGKRAKAAIARARAKLTEQINEREIATLAQQFAQRTSTAQRKAINKQTQHVLGVEVLTHDAWLKPLVDGFVEANVGLIVDIGDDVAKRVEATVLRAVQGGTLHRDLARQLDDDFAFGEDRARLIATDQIGKAYGQIAAARHQEMGLTRFKWRTGNDSRVRGKPGGKYPKAKPSHWAREGVIYEYKNPPKGRNGEPELPGTPIRCRCQAEPVFDDILGELGDLPTKTEQTVEAPKPVKRVVKPRPKPVEAVRPTATQADAQAVLRATSPAAVRGALDVLIGKYGLTRRAMPHADSIGVQADADMGGAAAYAEIDPASKKHGRIVISKSMAQRLEDARGEVAQGGSVSPHNDAGALVHLLTHEVIHAHGPDAVPTYEGIGVAIEELTTEVSARRIIRDTTGTSLAQAGFSGVGWEGGAYSGYIQDLTHEVATVLGGDANTPSDAFRAFDLITDAALKYKRRSNTFGTPEQAADAFADDLDLPDEARRRVRRRMQDLWGSAKVAAVPR